jgi:hypothetical protein
MPDRVCAPNVGDAIQVVEHLAELAALLPDALADDGNGGLGGDDFDGDIARVLAALSRTAAGLAKGARRIAEFVDGLEEYVDDEDVDELEEEGWFEVFDSAGRAAGALETAVVDLDEAAEHAAAEQAATEAAIKAARAAAAGTVAA